MTSLDLFPSKAAASTAVRCVALAFSQVYSAQGCWSAGYLAVTGDVPQIRADEASAYIKPHTAKQNEIVTNSQSITWQRCKQINVKERILVTKLMSL